MSGFSHANANLSRIFETVVRLVIGPKFLYSEVSRPGCLSRGVTSPTFSRVGKRPTVKDRFARCAITLDSSAVHCVSNEMGKVSSGDVLVSAACISGATSAAVTRVNVDKKLQGAV